MQPGSSRAGRLDGSASISCWRGIGTRGPPLSCTLAELAEADAGGVQQGRWNVALDVLPHEVRQAARGAGGRAFQNAHEAAAARTTAGSLPGRGGAPLPPLMVAAVRSARSRIPRSIFWLITKLSSSVGSTTSRAHARAYT